MKTNHTHRFAIPLILLILLLSACQATPAPAGDAAASATDVQTAESAFPVPVERCGEEVTFAAPPERAIVFEANMIEIMLYWA